MKVVVTGGAGFLGSHLVNSLVERGDSVTVIDNLHRGRVERIQAHISAKRVLFSRADIRDYAKLVNATKGAEIVYHLAAQSNVMGAFTDPDYSFTTNVIGTFNVLKAAAANRVRRVVFSSSREVYGDPQDVPVSESASMMPKNPYGASKTAGEAYCSAWNGTSGTECAVLRFANIYGPGDSDRVIPLWMDKARSGGDLEIYGGEQTLDFIHVDYAVAALLASEQRSNVGPVNVGSGRGVSIRDLANRVLLVTGSRSRLRILPAREAEVKRFVADVTLMRDVLGVAPPEDPLGGLAALARN